MDSSASRLKSRPTWFEQLEHPPRATGKSTLPNPPGYPSEANSSKVRHPILRYNTYQLRCFTERAKAGDKLTKILAPRDGHPEDQEGMGVSTCPREGITHECCYDVHVGEQSADLQHHDGVHALQEPNPEPDADQSSVHEVRDGGNEEDNLVDESGIRDDEYGGFSIGDMEG